MTRIGEHLILILLPFNFVAIESYESNRLDFRIINGSLAKDPRNFYYQAALMTRNQHFCGGVILNFNHILTAAHCVYDNRRPSSIMVVLGSLWYSYPSIKRRVQKIFMHPGFDIKSLRHDLAILEIEPLRNWTSTIRNISLARNSPMENTFCTVSGWGATEVSDKGTSALRYAYVPVYSRKRCRRSYGSNFRREMFCAGYITGGIDACQGDSGGPIVCNNELAGIVSWGIECGKPNYPGVYVDVSYYLDWIHGKSGSTSIDFKKYSTLIFILFIFYYINLLR